MHGQLLHWHEAALNLLWLSKLGSSLLLALPPLASRIGGRSFNPHKLLWAYTRLQLGLFLLDSKWVGPLGFALV